MKAQSVGETLNDFKVNQFMLFYFEFSKTKVLSFFNLFESLLVVEKLIHKLNVSKPNLTNLILS